jgi:hypothetical protein
MSDFTATTLERLSNLAASIGQSCSLDLTNRVLSIGDIKYNFSAYRLDEGILQAYYFLVEPSLEERIIKKVRGIGL